MVAIPSLVDVSDVLPDLTARRGALVAEAHRIRTDILALARSPDSEFPPTAVETAGKAVAALLGRDPPPSRKSREGRLGEMNHSIRIHEAAADLLAREIEAEEGRASAIIRERIRPEFERRLRAVCLSLAKAQEASADFKQLEDDLVDKGVRGVSSMSPPFPNVLGGPRDPNGVANIFLRQARTAGLLTDKELPVGMPR